MTKIKREGEITQKILLMVSIFWAIFLIPAMLLALLVEHSPYITMSSNLEMIMILNITSFPLVIALCNFISWKLFFNRKHLLSILVILLPLVPLLIEVVVLDLYLIR